MIEVVVAALAFVAGAVLAWLLRGGRAKAEVATAETHLAFTSQQLQERTGELTALKAELAQGSESLRRESERRDGESGAAEGVILVYAHVYLLCGQSGNWLMALSPAT